MCHDTSLFSLPEEILLEIVSFLPKFCLIRSRCVSQKFARLTTPGAFRSLRFRAYGDEPQRFIEIAESENLRRHVREITCDTWNGPDFDNRTGFGYKIHPDFFNALPYISLFRNLDALHLRFSYDCGDWDVEEETADVRYRILDTVFRCLAGTWSEHEQRRIDKTIDHFTSAGYTITQCPATTSKSLIPLRTLTISNLEDFNDPRFTASEAFKTVTNSSSLVDLRLYIATHTIDTLQSSRNFTTRWPEKYDMFDALPTTWLRPTIAKNLRVLSLYCHEPWGWFPKMDFRLVGAGEGIPNLRVLALGNFVFSHEWQVEWFGSLGLEKLYLDGCAILFQANNWLGMTLDQSQTVLRGSDGRAHRISNYGYYVNGTRHHSRDKSEFLQGGVRWNHLLSHWANSMSNLRVFKMGQGHWDDIPNEAIDPTFYENAYKPADHEVTNQPFTHHGFQHFEYPSPGTVGSGIRRYGSPVHSDHGDVLKYVYWTNKYTGYDELWEERESRRKIMTTERWLGKYGDDEQRKLDIEDRAKDHAALDLFISTVDSRRMGMKTIYTFNKEIANEEFFAHDTITQYLEALGFQVSKHAYGLETSFEASVGSGGRQVVFCAEYDALPGIGHGCGHNLIATASVGAFLGKRCGKGELINSGAFSPPEDIAAAIMAHPVPSSIIGPDLRFSGLAGFRLISSHQFRVEFRGHAAHAAGQPWDGVNALDAAVAAYSNVALLRQQIHPDERVHGVIEVGGTVPGVITDYTRMHWHVRSSTVERGERLFQRVKACLEAGAAATGCRINYILQVLLSQLHTLCKTYVEDMAKIGETIALDMPEPASVSTDMGNVSHLVPSFHGAFTITSAPDVAMHSPKFAVAASTEKAHAAAIKAAKGMAMLAIRVLTDGNVAAGARRDFEADGS
ncbi:metal-dependent amidase aminoacylase carboxypeptidase [Fusarium albosuccineum]|uniref:Metal-dependent amidase aminoacylase carboxypeptidase n=1 Tax=Fusarium albosuccineum TaxID=1237068 RepID=A0A8H4LPV1_9HYPO|nr:metal-dependent amidase aminoacylase carboxypeptidase [Fusarium albosuccineum]